jgi:hypothetical protein
MIVKWNECGHVSSSIDCLSHDRHWITWYLKDSILVLYSIEVNQHENQESSDSS